MEELVMKYVCDVCGWEYDEEKGYPEGGIAPGTKWEQYGNMLHIPLSSVHRLYTYNNSIKKSFLFFLIIYSALEN